MTNVLSFDITRIEEAGGAVITPLIDGVMLTILAEQFEQDHGLIDPAGGYGGLVKESFPYGPIYRHFLGKSESLRFKAQERIFVLGCECGEVGCWPLTCLVSIRDHLVTWQNFEQPYRPTRDYSSFGPFGFELEQYEEALRSIPH